MVPFIQSSLSALDVFGKKMAVHANNIANVYSDDFKKSQARIKEGTGNTVDIDIKKVNTPGFKYSEISGDQLVDRELSNVELGEEIAQTMLTKRFFEANLKMVSTMDDMLGTVIDIIK